MQTIVVVTSIFAVVCFGGLAAWLFIQKRRLSRELCDAKSEKREAQRLLYLSQVSLQASVGAFYSERVRSDHLENTCAETVNNYREFREKIKEKAESRLARKGIAAAASFVPGLSLLDILGDLSDILSDIGDNLEEIVAAEKALKRFSNVPRADFSDILTDVDIPIALTPDAQNVFIEAFKQNMSSVEKLETSIVDSCVKDTIQNMRDLESIKSMNKDELHNAIKEIHEKVKDYVLEDSDHSQTRGEQSEGSASRLEAERTNQPTPE